MSIVCFSGTPAVRRYCILPSGCYTAGIASVSMEAAGDAKDYDYRCSLKFSNSLSSQSLLIAKIASCAALLIFTVSATVLTDLSRAVDGTYPYNTFVIPCAVEAAKLLVSTVMLFTTHILGHSVRLSFSYSGFLSFALPAFCYFVSNNCMFYIIRELGPTTYQITSNLKVLSTALLMRACLARKLSWTKWKALVLLVLGSVVAELTDDDGKHLRGSFLGYFAVISSCFISSLGGVLSEKLLKGTTDLHLSDCIHWQNIQLYFFGVIFGLFSLVFLSDFNVSDGVFHGFNFAAYAAVTALMLSGVSVSFILKYMDNIAKCFVMAASTLCVAWIHTSLKNENISLRLLSSIALTFLALDQYNAKESPCLSCLKLRLARQ